MHRENGRLKPADKKESATFRDRYFKCERCNRITIITNVDFAEERVCNKCGGKIHETSIW